MEVVDEQVAEPLHATVFLQVVTLNVVEKLQ